MHTHSAVTLSGVCLAILLFFSEVGRYRSASRATTVSLQGGSAARSASAWPVLNCLNSLFALQMGVDVSRGEHLRITLNLTLPALPCAGESDICVAAVPVALPGLALIVLTLS